MGGECLRTTPSTHADQAWCLDGHPESHIHLSQNATFAVFVVRSWWGKTKPTFRNLHMRTHNVHLSMVSGPCGSREWLRAVHNFDSEWNLKFQNFIFRNIVFYFFMKYNIIYLSGKYAISWWCPMANGSWRCELGLPQFWAQTDQQGRVSKFAIIISKYTWN